MKNSAVFMLVCNIFGLNASQPKIDNTLKLLLAATAGDFQNFKTDQQPKRDTEPFFAAIAAARKEELLKAAPKRAPVQQTRPCYRCRFCEAEFVFENCCARHMAKQHPSQNESQPLQQNKSQPPKKRRKRCR